jgi:hypothetical protein
MHVELGHMKYIGCDFISVHMQWNYCFKPNEQLMELLQT